MTSGDSSLLNSLTDLLTSWRQSDFSKINGNVRVVNGTVVAVVFKKLKKSDHSGDCLSLPLLGYLSK